MLRPLTEARVAERVPGGRKSETRTESNPRDEMLVRRLLCCVRPRDLKKGRGEEGEKGHMMAFGE